MSTYRWHVLGAGSLGSLWACRLAAAGVPVSLLLRSSQRLLQYQQAGGLALQRACTTEQWPLPAELLSAEVPISHLLLACKAYDAEAAALALAPRVLPGAQVLLLQNGLGSQQAVRQHLAQARCIAVSSTEGAFRQADWQVVQAGVGQNWLGDGGEAPAWLADLRAAGIASQWVANIDSRLWRKLAINCAINPLTVLLGCRNGELAQHHATLATLCAELEQLLHHCGQPPAAEPLLAEVQRVIQATAANYSSMHQDVQRRQRTEISFLLGHAMAQAHRHRLRLPALAALHTRLQGHLRALGLPVN
ncbi:putative 2-dehydropantoate 2-reductase [Pseudomonas typographi]|uniref:2-dehydropantoate 2-reductase n=1 Tax=Pseudomonas typographi TaxID=2715964 RepID=A0ABR7YW98_9PSED|nr:putative 2-dehydropantoate 2-reductase [Pseudomonas typographi]MBD1552541.1 putative 2-dehydropantoate 2-reductase [Pseudomonas typographi]MBD1597455.1 putative 2-dehydropantoate 2-reductase [Pseudomonas typographi]